MRLLRSNSLAAHITSVVLAASGIALAILVTALLVWDRMSSTVLLQHRLVTLADIVGQTSTAALHYNDKPAASDVLQVLRTEPSVFSACLYDTSDRLFAEYHRQPGAPPCRSDRIGFFAQSSGHRSVLRPVYRHNQRVGMLALTSDLQELDDRRNHLLLLAGGLALLSLTLGGVCGLVLQRRVSQPILNLAKAMREVTSGQALTTRVEASGSDEITQLGHGFNSMLSELERRDLETKGAEAKLQYQASNDALTNLPNRRLFADRLAQTLAQAHREPSMLGLLYIDLDGFKLVNDSLGHIVGDALLCQVAGRLRSRVRQSDTLARVGGDEFTVILVGLKRKEEAALVADSLLDALAKPFVIEGHEITIGASVGISIFPDDATGGTDLMRQADSAMYAAKRNGKNQAMFFRPELGLMVRERLNLENQLRGAMARGEIKIHYQPEFEVSSGRLVRFEALARWFHPTLGLIPPDKFIPIAEDSGLIIPLGNYIMERACSEAAQWQCISPYPVQVAVNVSSIQFNRDSFVEEVVRTLQRTGLDPALLQLELTETVMVGSLEHSAAKMRRLRSLGISLAIDDFGTGYSCLSYLPGLPFDALKIDRSFVRDISSRPETVSMVRSLVGLAHNIGMRVIVEGIEEPQQLQLIREVSANEIQGFLLGRPTPDPISQLREAIREQESKREMESADQPVAEPVPA